MTHLAASAARVTFKSQIRLRTNLKFVVAMPEAVGLTEVYAKVLDLLPHPEEDVSIHACTGFTVLPDDVNAFLERHCTTAASGYLV